MDPIQDELKQLQEDQKKSENAVATANGALASSQVALNQAKANRNDVTQRLTPLQRLANDLEASHAALEKERISAVAGSDEAEKFYAEVFPLVQKAVDPTKRAALEKIEQDLVDLEKSNTALGQKIGETKAAQKAAQDNVSAADSAVREGSTQFRALGMQIQTARQQLSSVLAAARNAFVLGHMGGTFLQLRDVHAQALALANLADTKTEENLHQAVEKAWQDRKAAKLDVDAKDAELAKLTKDAADGEINLQRKRLEAVVARAALAADKTS